MQPIKKVRELVLKKVLLVASLLLLIVPVVALQTTEDEPTPIIEITGVNASDLPTALITVNVFDTLHQPVQGLTIDDVILTGELAEVAQVISVEHVQDSNLPLSVVLMIDTSSSMAGDPLASAQEAAAIFVETLSENDQAAIMTFNNQANLILDYTNDKEALLHAIETLPFGGQTALYDAGLSAVEKAADSPTSRRAVVFLSDGAEYGGISTAGRESAVTTARIRGVPVYTIGLGYGVDRSYLEELAGQTNARNYESPRPDELPAIYAEIANLLRTQYIITLNADVPLDGQEYDFVLQAETDEGLTNEATGTIRAPIPVPLITGFDVPSTPIETETTITASIAADDEVQSVSDPQFGAWSGNDDGTYSVVVDPRQYAPGVYTIDLTVTDVDGDSSTASSEIEIAALPAEIRVEGITDGETFEGSFLPGDSVSVEVIVDFVQTPLTSVDILLDGETITSAAEAPYTADIPLTTAGNHVITITVNTEAGSNDTEIPFSITIIATPTPTATPSPTPDFNATATVEADAALQVQMTADAQSTQDAADAQATQDAVDVQATQDAVDAQATQDADAQATQDAVDVQATQDADAQATQDAVDVQATQDADAQATQDAVDVQATQDAVDVQATQDADAAIQSANVYATATAIIEQATQDTADAQATQDAVDAQATQDAVDAQATQDAVDAQSTQDAVDAQATQDAVDAQATLDAVTPTLSDFAIQATNSALTREAAPPTLSDFAVQATSSALTREAVTPTVEPTLTPIGDLTEVDAPGAPEEETNDLIPIAAICGGALLLLIVVLLLRRKPKGS